MKKRVLLIHTEALVREALSQQLKRHHYDVRCACNGQDASQNADFRQVDVLLINLDVPLAESQGILSRLAELNPLLPVVGLTENASPLAGVPDSRLSAVIEDPTNEGNLLRIVAALAAPAPAAPGGIRVAALKAAALNGDPDRRVAGRGICPTAHRGWGIND